VGVRLSYAPRVNTQLSIPLWALLGFATWTLLVLIFTIGMYRLTQIFFAKAEPASFKADQVEGADWYKRAMRAHANCVENLPVFGAIVVLVEAAHVKSVLIDWTAIAILTGRVFQSLTHVSVRQTNAMAMVRFSFFFVQVVGYFVLIAQVTFA
jgi:uncharacterized MAPEG superfamily protein